MGKDAKARGKGKGKQAASGSDENASKGKGECGKAADGLGTCTYVKGMSYVRNKVRLMKPTRSCRMVGLATEIRFLRKNLQRLMKSQTMGDAASFEFMRSRSEFEINHEHPIIKNSKCMNLFFSYVLSLML
ncbi:uncharacterized protein LOC131602435 isoform X1 [Vicia villosa]|uniref:uncharacterized protein LOC131602435 isoform X1 n=1 Tax=Vicia villosa TaxID=3911 RepID=UPI00273B7200|nr:uncharacterized protein LOC131602435 isoform X1 [Vicia villosa]XP_058730529.1 uncharacterized protein LOC131602435 isoform X1 [Vicia villosa]XP_058730530.1 uncharacterized protein LOC131602435 isoform X1 [Vicia villosa]